MSLDPLGTRPPVATRRPERTSIHGRVRTDDYAWMADTDSDEFRRLVDAENAYAEAMTASQESLRGALMAEFLARFKQSDLSVPVAHAGYWWYSRTRAGDQYPLQARIPIDPGGPNDPASAPILVGDSAPTGEQVVLDPNLEAGDHEFYEVGPCEVSVDNRLLAYGVDTTGDERYDLKVIDIATRRVLDEALRGIGETVALSHDGSYVLYTRLDDAWRPHQVWRHLIGGPAEADVLVLAEADPRFHLAITTSRDERWILIAALSRDSAEWHLLPALDPAAQPRLVSERADGVEYYVEVGSDRIYLVHNRNRVDFEVATAALTGPLDDWRPLPVTDEADYVTGVDAFEQFLVVSLRRAGSPCLRVVPLRSGAEAFDINLDDPVRGVSLEANPDRATGVVRYTQVGLIQPARVVEFEVDSRSATVLKTTEVLGGLDLGQYVQRREWARSADGTMVPLSIVHHRDLSPDNSAAGWLYGYGAYGIETDPWFSVSRLSLLERGVVFAIAHVRGGCELGRAWYDDGRLQHKQHSIEDFLACADRLVELGLCDPDRLAAQGGSAGGLLVAAAINQAPDRFRAVHAEVPFVDVLTSLLDPDLPLSVIEWQEWGDPLHDPAAFDRIAGYSPVDNVRAQRYPLLLATAGLHDTRVLATEPVKWVARLRAVAGPDRVPDARPILLRTTTDAGHGGASGRYQLWRETMWEHAVLLGALDCATPVQQPSEPASTSTSVATPTSTPTSPPRSSVERR